MRAITNHFQNSIRGANGKKETADPQQANKIVKTMLFCFLLSASASLKSQVQDTGLPTASETKERPKTAVASNSTTCFLPVYFNYRRRQLKYNGIQRMDPVAFLTMCRGIKDSTVQEQIARYDGYTFEKQKLGLAALGNGFAAFGLLGGATTTAGKQDQALTTSLVVVGVLAVLAVPVIAIYSGVPHKKRKAVLFRDLPIAYNAFVESQQSNPACAAILNH